jgi:hypothetical protein
MNFDDQQAESFERTEELEGAKFQGKGKNPPKSQGDENQGRTKEIEEGKKKPGAL